MKRKSVHIVEATPADKASYNAGGHVYPLYGYATLPSGRVLVIEDLRGSWSPPDPIYEVMAPVGFHFKDDLCHSALCHSLADVRDRLRYAELEMCDKECPTSEHQEVMP